MSYVKAFWNDLKVASITPSSKYLVQRSISALNLPQAKTIVEYGAARGVMTREILKQMRLDATLLAIEFNADLFDELKEIKDPRLMIFNGDVQEIDKILTCHNISGVDSIISGVPFAFFDKSAREDLLNKTWRGLNKDGRFVAYQVTTHLLPLLKDRFSSVNTQWEILNLPPHFVFTALK